MKNRTNTIQHISFSGEILKRGFWLYIWRITKKRIKYYYVGRTGDNSSVNAASPFSRLSQHLDLRKSASANMLSRHLQSINVEPQKCLFEMFAIGPIYPEQTTKKKHMHYRDLTGSLEASLALYLKNKNFKVLGTHPTKTSKDQQTLKRIYRIVDKVVLKSGKDNISLDPSRREII